MITICEQAKEFLFLYNCPLIKIYLFLLRLLILWEIVPYLYNRLI